METFGQLFGALAEAQKEIKNPRKDKEVIIKGENKFGKQFEKRYYYSDLSTVLDQVKGPLAKYGLSIIQFPNEVEKGLVLTTILAHSSGEKIESSVPLPLESRPQDLGSYITYMRRYSICSLLAINGEDDDDGEIANQTEIPKRTFAQPMQKPEIESKEVQTIGQEIIPSGTKLGSEATKSDISIQDLWFKFKPMALRRCMELKKKQDDKIELSDIEKKFMIFGLENKLVDLTCLT